LIEMVARDRNKQPQNLITQPENPRVGSSIRSTKQGTEWTGSPRPARAGCRHGDFQSFGKCAVTSYI